MGMGTTLQAQESKGPEPQLSVDYSQGHVCTVCARLLAGQPGQ